MPQRKSGPRQPSTPRGTVLVIALSRRATVLHVRAANANGRDLAAAVRPGTMLRDYVHEDDRAPLAAALRRVAATPKRPAKLRLRLASGRRWVPLQATLTARRGGIELALRRDEIALLEQVVRQLHDVVEGIAHPILVRDGSRLLYANDALLGMLGCGSRTEVEALGDVVHPDDLPLVLDGAADGCEVRLRRRDSSFVWAGCRSSRILWDGAPALLDDFTDIDARKRAEAGRARAETLFGAVFHSSPDVLLLRSAGDDRLVDVNDGFLRLFRLERKEAIGRTCRELGIWKDAAEPAVPGGELADGAIHTVHMPDGGQREFAITTAPARLADRELLLTRARDVTELRRHEQELRRSKEAAERANRSKSEFLAHMSHEIRTPLNAIVGFAEVIGQQMLGRDALGKYVEYADDIRDSGQHLLQIVNDILDLSKLEAGKFELHEGVVLLDRVVAASLALISGRAREAGVDIATDVAEQLPAVRADERALKQILLNLLSNAVKFTPRGGKITITVRSPTSGALEISVSDTGIGMSPADIETAFAPFGQVDNPLTRRHRGTGLGLPLVRSLVEQHGGTLTIRSAVSQGTTVTVTLPANRVLAARCA